MEIITREEAQEKGLVRYFTGKPCKHGHIAERYTKSLICCPCSTWHNNTRYKEDKRYRDRIKKYQKEYYQKNSDYVKARVDRWTAENKEKVKAYRKFHNQKNKARLNSLKAAYKAIKKSGTLSGVNQNHIEWFYKERDRLAELTGVPHHVDHIVPLQGRNVCGLHVPWNLQVIPAHENLSKSNKFGG